MSGAVRDNSTRVLIGDHRRVLVLLGPVVTEAAPQTARLVGILDLTEPEPSRSEKILCIRVIVAVQNVANKSYGHFGRFSSYNGSNGGRFDRLRKRKY